MMTDKELIEQNKEMFKKIMELGNTTYFLPIKYKEIQTVISSIFVLVNFVAKRLESETSN